MFVLSRFQSSLLISGNSSDYAWVGFIGAGVAVVFFGSNFVPVKKFDTGDG